MSDQELVDLLVGYGDTEDFTYVLEWDQSADVMAVALDQAGMAGSLYKKAFTPRKSDIQTSAVTVGRKVHSLAEQQRALEQRIERHQAQPAQNATTALFSLMPQSDMPRNTEMVVTTISNKATHPSLVRIRNSAR